MPTLPPFTLCILLLPLTSLHPPRPLLFMYLLTHSKVANSLLVPSVLSDVLPVTGSLKTLIPVILTPPETSNCPPTEQPLEISNCPPILPPPETSNIFIFIIPPVCVWSP